MLTPLSLTFFQGGRTIRRIRSATQRRIQDEPAIRLLHSLLDITITPTPILNPGLILTHKGGIALCGPPSSGRSLSLLQIQARWADSGSNTPLIALNLSTDDVPNLSPRAVVAGAIHRASLAAIYGEGNRPMVLLIDDWEDLPADRRTLWRSYVLAAATWATARVVISLPQSEEWPGLTSIALTAPADDMLETWIGRLLPGHDSAPIMAALQQEPLAELRNHIGDLLLLALIYPITGLPMSRSQLYEQAYALARPVLNGTNGQICVGRATLRYYRLARSFVSGADLATMIDLPDHEIAAVAPLAAGLLDDPRPVLKLLWANGEPSQAGLDGLARCLRERPSAAPEQYLPFVRLLMTQEDYKLRTLITPALPDLLAIVSHSDIAQSSSVLKELATSWPPTEAINLLLRLIGHTNAARELRWAAADILAGWQNLPNNIAHLPADADEITRATYAYIIALAAPTLRQLLLHAALRPGLDSLIAGSGGDQRWSNVATALTADPACPNELHALVLAKAPAQSEGATLIQSALTERSPALRHSALAALEARPATEVLHLLGTALDNTGHNDDVIHDLLAHIARLPQLEATGLIARYALNDQGGTIARIIALRLIARRPGGVALLQRFLAADHIPTPLRA
ncbi:MAG: hypothetical protein HGA19_18775, partial [Oscillochloris sp.]|nr:hypothetical protein [Oscillochloris sp.]